MVWLKERNKDVCPLGAGSIREEDHSVRPCQSEINSKYDCEYRSLAIVSSKGATVKCRYGSSKLPRRK